jgi:hypothetical protein
MREGRGEPPNSRPIGLSPAHKPQDCQIGIGSGQRLTVNTRFVDVTPESDKGQLRTSYFAPESN